MNAEEFDALYAASFRKLVGQVCALTGDRDEAQECVQEAFVRAWSYHPRLHNPEAWLRTTAYRLAVSRWRSTVRRRRSPDRALQRPTVAPEPCPDHVALMAALQRLPEPQRRAVVLHHLCDLSVSDVAAEVGAPEGTVKARLARGRAALFGVLGDGPAGEAAQAPRHA